MELLNRGGVLFIAETWTEGGERSDELGDFARGAARLHRTL